MSFYFLRGPSSGHLDVSRMLWGLSVLSGICYCGAHLVIILAFSFIVFGTGLVLLLAGGGTATALTDTAGARAIGSGQ